MHTSIHFVGGKWFEKNWPFDYGIVETQRKKSAPRTNIGNGRTPQHGEGPDGDLTKDGPLSIDLERVLHVVLDMLAESVHLKIRFLEIKIIQYVVCNVFTQSPSFCSLFNPIWPPY